jgi:hypothetical protein
MGLHGPWLSSNWDVAFQVVVASLLGETLTRPIPWPETAVRTLWVPG